ncbi:MAG: hypothetical protein IJC26_00520 [Clostridia bacterium]|nr:hypothetical protein [Clostridia bacterium]
MKNQRKRLLALVAMVLLCTMVLPVFGGCGKKEEAATTTAEEVFREEETVESVPATSQTPVATKSDPNAESLQSTPNKGGNKRVTSGTTSVKSKYSLEQEALAQLDVNAAKTVEDRRNYAEAYMRAMLTFQWKVQERPATQVATTDGKTLYLRDYADEAAWQKAVDGTAKVIEDPTDYVYKVGSYTFPLEAGLTYRGLPYSNGDSGLETFKLFVEDVDENGVSKMNTRFDVVYLYGGEAIGRLGNTNASALIYAWNTVSYSSRAQYAYNMIPRNGYYFVKGIELPMLEEEEREAIASKPPIPDPKGELVGAGVAGEFCGLFKDNSLSGDTDEIVKHNGEQGMYAAYANLKKADGLIRSENSEIDSDGDPVLYNDAKMVVSVTVEKNEDGTINGDLSKIKVLSQTPTITAVDENGKEYTVDKNGALFEKDQDGKSVKVELDAEAKAKLVYCFGEVDKEYTFKELLDKYYVPMTVKELVDGTADIDGAMVRDQYNYDKRQTGAYMYSGIATGSRRIIWVNMVLTDAEGKVIYNNTALSERSDVKLPAATETGRYVFDLAKFDDNHEKIVSLGDDVVANSKLAEGTYHYKVTAHLITGEDIVVRDFDFTKE